MELTKKNIHMNKCKCKQAFQFTLDSDCNVTDVKPDIEELIFTSGELKINEQKLLNDKLYLKGVLRYCSLYNGEGETGIQGLQGEMHFDEVINMEGCTGGETLSISKTIDDLTGTMIHSRKINIKALISMELLAEELHDEEAAVAIGTENEDIRILTKSVSITSMAVDTRDTCRIREGIELPADKPDMREIIYKDISLRNTDSRMLEDKVSIKGDLNVFFIYTGDGESPMPVYVEKVLPVSMTVECGGCSESMIPCVQMDINNLSLEIKPDEDGEERIAELEAVYDVRIRAYEEAEPEIIQDMYSPRRSVQPVYNESSYENLLIRNSTKLWVSERERLPEDYPAIMSICHVTGNIKLDNTYISSGQQGDSENTPGIVAEGVVEASVFYISEDDMRPLQVFKINMPFSKLIDVPGIDNSACYNIWPEIDQMSVIVPDGRETEVKAGVTLNTVVFKSIQENFVVDYEEKEFDKEELRNMPAMTGYIVKSGDTLWNIAKRYNTTVETLREVNELESDRIRSGDQLLVIKDIGSI